MFYSSGASDVFPQSIFKLNDEKIKLLWGNLPIGK